MWRVILVEDEVFVRESVKELIDWNSMGFEVAGEAGNGVEALQLIHDMKPDLVLADIIMPQMDGIELLKKTREAGYKTKFVMLTCMSEFEYLRQAMEYGASNYILKLSMNVKDLRETLGKIREELNKELAETASVQGTGTNAPSKNNPASEDSAKHPAVGIKLEEEKITHPEVNKIIAYIEEHYAEDLSVKFLSQYVVMGENYVSSLFKKKTGQTLIHYLHQVRVEKAIWYLKNSKLAISEIGAKVGFVNDNYFIKIFKRFTNETPSQYRKQHE
ncbi:response regulator transcription factor [Paenibacillus sp. IITD108]|uniref:response regulator transcription factor n=1 Tax=Paenibacillus sp. IITD108 TaxID=3116649 RepID=UPI003FA78807